MEAERHGTLTEAAVAVAEVPCCKRKGQVKKKKKKKAIHCVPDLQNTAKTKSKTKQK